MNYELAKELKKAGFPQHHDWLNDGCSVDWVDGCNKNCGKNIVIRKDLSNQQQFNDSEYVCIPTLEELIKACGNDFLELHKNLANNKIDFGWFACTIDTIRNPKLSTFLRGKTPEEAVSRLWLYLNKKSNFKYDPNKLYYTPKEKFYRCIKNNKELKVIIGDVFEWEEDIKAYIHKDNFGHKKVSAFSMYTVGESSLLHVLKLIERNENFIKIYPQT